MQSKIQLLKQLCRITPANEHLVAVFAAILNNKQAEIPASQIELVTALRLFPARSRLWKYVQITGPVCRRCGTALLGGFCQDCTCLFADHVQTCPRNEGADCTCDQRIIAVFIPQHEDKDFICDNPAGEHRRFDVTEAILKMPREAALQIEDNRESSDALMTPEIMGNHDGPYRVLVEDAIRDYFSGIDNPPKA